VFRIKVNVHISSIKLIETKKTANGLFGDAAHIINRGVLYLPNVMWFHLTHANEISFTPIIKVFVPLQIFTKLVSAEHHYVQTADTEFRAHRTVSAQSAGRHSFTSLSKVWLSQWDDFH
jgi:hypothetical protein